MCDEKDSERIKRGVEIDAPFPQNMVLAYEVLQREGYDIQTDYLHVNNQFENQVTRVRYIKTVPLIDEKTGVRYQARHFELTMPDRYVPATEAPEGAIRSEKDI